MKPETIQTQAMTEKHPAQTISHHDGIIESVRQANNYEQLMQACQHFCMQVGFKNYLLSGTIFTSMTTPLRRTIYSPGKAATLKHHLFENITHACINSITPIINGNIAKNSPLQNSGLNIHSIANARKLSISFPVHFSCGKYAFFHIFTNTLKQDVEYRIINCLSVGNLFALEASNVLLQIFKTEVANSHPYLSQRESECLLLASEGASPKQIGEQTGLSPHTVNAYLKKARAKLNSKNIGGAICKAMLSGEIVPRIGSEKV